MRLNKKKSNKTERVQLRCSIEEFNRIQTKANLYTEGNVSEYLLYVALEFVPGAEDLTPNKEDQD